MRLRTRLLFEAFSGPTKDVSWASSSSTVVSSCGWPPAAMRIGGARAAKAGLNGSAWTLNACGTEMAPIVAPVAALAVKAIAAPISEQFLVLTNQPLVHRCNHSQ